MSLSTYLSSPFLLSICLISRRTKSTVITRIGLMAWLGLLFTPAPAASQSLPLIYFISRFISNSTAPAFDELAILSTFSSSLSRLISVAGQAFSSHILCFHSHLLSLLYHKNQLFMRREECRHDGEEH